MMKRIFYVAAAAALLVTSEATAQSKFDATSQSIANAYIMSLKNPDKVIAAPVGSYIETNTAVRTPRPESCFVRMAPGITADDLTEQGFLVTAVVDDIAVIVGSMDDIISLADTDLVNSISFARELTPMLDKARAATGMDAVHAGTNIEKAYTGAGVIAGIYDSGIDPYHINFYDKDFTDTRVERFWKFTTNGGSFIEYTKDKIPSAKTDKTTGTHGTHVLGCMAGAHNQKGNSSKYPKGSFAKLSTSTAGQPYADVSASSRNPYYGAAPGATIAACGGELYDTNILTGVSKIVEYAKSQGKPAVINLSIGTTVGPHDGTSAFCTALDKFAEDAIIVVSAGNEGDENFTIVREMTFYVQEVKTFIAFTGASTSGVVSVYGNNTSFSVIPVVYQRSTGKILYQFENNTASEKTLATSNYTAPEYLHDSNFEKYFTQSYIMTTGSDNASTSKRQRRSYSISYNLRNSSENTSADVVIGLIVRGNIMVQYLDRVEMTNHVASGNAKFSSLGIDGWADGTPDLSINDMACGNNTICVGAWNTRESWATLGRVIYSYNNVEANGLQENHVAGYSSYGILRDGRRLPHVCAPGTGIVSSLNSYYDTPDNEKVASYTWGDRTYVWGVEQGTSMASPFVAGAIATWLEADPTLTVDKVRDIIKKTATMDEYTYMGSPIKWGAGKFNALEGLKEVIRQRAAVDDILADGTNAKDLIIESKGGNLFEVFLGGADAIRATLYSISGVPMLNVNEAGDTASLDASALAPGIYILNVNGIPGKRIIVK